MEKRKAIVFGGTGLVGKALIDELLKSDNYDEVKVFVRSKAGFTESSKIKVFVADFDLPGSFTANITGDDLFISLGTTIKKAGSVKRMEQIDRDLPVSLAGSARNNGVKRIAVVSSIGADKNSSNYYLRIKGEMEQGILALDFETTAIVRPSLLLGARKERRIGEQAGKAVIRILGLFLVGKFRKYRGIEGRDVAKAMLSILQKSQGREIYESDKIQKIALTSVRDM